MFLSSAKSDNISINIVRSNQLKYLKHQSEEEIKWMGKAIQIAIHCSLILGQKQPNKSIINTLFMKDDTILIIERVIIIQNQQ